MDDAFRNMMRREARQSAIGHTIALFGLHAAVGFLMPRFLVLFENDLATRGSVANVAAGLSIGLGHNWKAIVPIILLFGYLDYRVSLLLRFRRMDGLAAAWSAALVGSFAAGLLWFCWALSEWPIIVWERLNPNEAVPKWASSGTWRACVLFIVAFVGLVALDLVVGRRDRNPGSDTIERQRPSGAGPRGSSDTP